MNDEATNNKDLTFLFKGNSDEDKTQRKRINVCYYTLKLAEYGELF